MGDRLTPAPEPLKPTVKEFNCSVLLVGGL